MALKEPCDCSRFCAEEGRNEAQAIFPRSGLSMEAAAKKIGGEGDAREKRYYCTESPSSSIEAIRIACILLNYDDAVARTSSIRSVGNSYISRISDSHGKLHCGLIGRRLTLKNKENALHCCRCWPPMQQEAPAEGNLKRASFPSFFSTVCTTIWSMFRSSSPTSAKRRLMRCHIGRSFNVQSTDSSAFPNTHSYNQPIRPACIENEVTAKQCTTQQRVFERHALREAWLATRSLSHIMLALHHQTRSWRFGGSAFWTCARPHDTHNERGPDMHRRGCCCPWGSSAFGVVVPYASREFEAKASKQQQHDLPIPPLLLTCCRSVRPFQDASARMQTQLQAARNDTEALACMTI